MAKPIIDAEWHRLITNRPEDSIPDSPDENRRLYLEWWENKTAPHGCGLHMAFHDKPEGPHWQCKFSIGGQQRILGYGTCYQMAVLYDAAKLFFAKYRPNRKNYAWTCNFPEADTANRLSGDSANHFLRSFLENMELLLTKRGELSTADSRAIKRRDRQHSYTTAGQLRYAIESILAIVEPLAVSIDKMSKQLDELKKIWTPNPPEVKCPKCDNYYPGYATGGDDVCDCHEVKSDTDTRLTLVPEQNQVTESLKLFFTNNPEINEWRGSTIELHRLVKVSVFRYNTNRLAKELESFTPFDGCWIFSRAAVCKSDDSVQ